FGHTWSPLIGAAHLGKFRLVRLLVEGGAQINERNQRGETPLLAACKALGGQQGGGPSLRLLQYLLENQADPNSQDKAGRTALMYACMGRAGPEVAAALIAAGADPSLEDYGGASSLVYAINARDQDTLQVLLDACRQKGRDIIIIATELTAGGGSVTRRYLNVPPSPHSSPVHLPFPRTRIPREPGSRSKHSRRDSCRRGSARNLQSSGSRREGTLAPPARWAEPGPGPKVTPPLEREPSRHRNSRNAHVFADRSDTNTINIIKNVAAVFV
uniref:Ankyrin repeat domain-containing protein 34A-like n=1 Tax=Scleropages formosus TaxID=113540 RepID=A0A8C9T1A0_SCLFO